MTKAEDIPTIPNSIKKNPFLGWPFRNCPHPGKSTEQRSGKNPLSTPRKGSDLDAAVR
jgi:hypothetical protein